MKKLILLCLLGYLCVLTSTTTAQVADSPPETDLVDYSGLPGQEGESSSASVGENVWIYLEIEGHVPDKPLVLSRWKRYKGLGFGKEEGSSRILETVWPDFFRGMLPTVSVASNAIIDSIAKPEYISIALGPDRIIAPMLVFPGDSLLIRYNTNSSELLFSGPQGAGLQLQILLDQLLDTHGFTPGQVIVVEDKAEYLSKPGTLDKLDSAGRLFGRFLQVVQKGNEEMDIIGTEISDSDLDYQADKLLDVYRNYIPDDRLRLYQSDVLGKHYAKIARKLGRIIEGYPDASGDEKVDSLLNLLTRRFTTGGFKESLFTAGAVDFWIDLSETRRLRENIPPLKWISMVQKGYSRDLLVESYFLRKGMSLQDFDDQLEKGIALVSDIVVLEDLQAMKAARAIGTKFSPVEFLSRDGSKVTLDYLIGKVVLVEFWISGCGACYSTYQDILVPLETHFGDEERFEVVSVSADKNMERWKKNIGKYSNAEGENLFVPEDGFEALNAYGIHSYPAFLLLGKDGQILRLSGFRRDKDFMISLIEDALTTEFKPTL